jgi:hypothetical protein
MAPKGLLHFRAISLLVIICAFQVVLVGCGKKQKTDIQEDAVVFEPVDTSQIPADTISMLDSTLVVINGIYHFNNQPYSGYLSETYDEGMMKSVGAYLHGMQHGATNSFYPDGSIKDIRSYKENRAYGQHVGYWLNGKMKFDFSYFNESREGLQQQWYVSGSPYAFLNFKNDREHGLQQAWRPNGKAYINYETRDGFRYGLQKSALCYTLEDEEMKTIVLPNQAKVATSK